MREARSARRPKRACHVPAGDAPNRSAVTARQRQLIRLAVQQRLATLYLSDEVAADELFFIYLFHAGHRAMHRTMQQARGRGHVAGPGGTAAGVTSRRRVNSGPRPRRAGTPMDRWPGRRATAKNNHISTKGMHNGLQCGRLRLLQWRRTRESVHISPSGRRHPCLGSPC